MSSVWIRTFGLLGLLVFVGCGEAPKPKTEDPTEIEKIRLKAMENAQREQSTSK